MILADTSVWADHLRAADATFERLLDANTIYMHPFVLGEIALGYIRQRELILSRLSRLLSAPIVRDSEVLHLINSRDLAGSGVGYIDVHLLASVRLLPGTGLWTRDKRLHAVAETLGFAISPDRGISP